jgi:hypothetical protein
MIKLELPELIINIIDRKISGLDEKKNMISSVLWSYGGTSLKHIMP